MTNTNSLRPDIPNGAIRYYTNSRGANYLPIMYSEWEKSGFLQRFDTNAAINIITFSSLLDAGLSPDPTTIETYFRGVNKTSMWWFYNKSDNDYCLHNLRDIGINSIRVFLDIYVYQKDKNLFLNNLKNFMSLCDSHKMRVQLVIWDGIDISPLFIKITDKNKTYAGMARGITASWQCNPYPFEVSSVAARDDFYTTCAVPYLTDIVSSVSSYQSLWSFDVLNEEYVAGVIAEAPLTNPGAFSGSGEQLKLLASSTAIYLKSLVSSINVKITAGQGGYNPFSGTLTNGNPNTAFPSTQELFSSVIDFGSIHLYANTRYHRFRYYNEALSGARMTGNPAMINESGYNDYYSFYHVELEDFKEGNMGSLCFDAFIDFAWSNEPFLNSQGIMYWDGTFKFSQDGETYRDIALETGWFSPNQLKWDITQKDISVNNGDDGGFYSGIIPWHQEYNPTLYTSVTESDWETRKAIYYASISTSGGTNPAFSKNYPAPKGCPVANSNTFSWVCSGLHISSLIGYLYDASSSLIPLLTSDTDGITRNTAILKLNELIKSISLSLVETGVNPTLRPDLIGSQYDYNPAPSSLRLDFSGAFNAMYGLSGLNPAQVNNAYLSLTSINIPGDLTCHVTSSCYYTDGTMTNIDWTRYQTDYEYLVDTLITCIDYFNTAALSNSDYRIY